MTALTPLSLIAADPSSARFAILDNRGRHNAAYLLGRAAGVARSLPDSDATLTASRRCIVSLNKGVGFFAGLLGCWMARRVPVLLDPMVRTELGDAISMTGAAAAILEKERLDAVPPDIDVLIPECGVASPPALPSITPDTVVLYLFTSGSTGRPTLVPKTYAQIAVEVAFLSALFGAPKRVAGLIPWCHIWGVLSSFLLPLKNGGVCDLRGGISARGVLSLISEDALDFVAAVPIYYTAMLKIINAKLVSVSGTSCRFASSSAPLSAGLRAAFEGAVGRGITDIFGSTEAGGIAYRHQDGPWRPEPHVEMRIDGDGMLAVRSPSVSFETADGFYPTGDMVRAVDNGFVLLGRGDDVVKIGGRRIALGEIKRVIESHPDVTRAEVLTNDVQGTKRLVAFVAAAREMSPGAVKRHIRTHLADHKVPRTVRFIEDFPMISSGKLDRQRLSALLEEGETKI